MLMHISALSEIRNIKHIYAKDVQSQANKYANYDVEFFVTAGFGMLQNK